MSENAKLDPATLSATVREMYPPPTPLVGWLGFYYDSSKDAPEDAGWYCSGKVHPDREEALCELAGFRPFEGSALVEVGQAGDMFAPATEKAVCPNCKEETGENHVSSYNRDSFTCQPATEKVHGSAFPVGNCPACGDLVAPYNKHAKYEGGYTCQPAQPEPADSRQERADQIKSFLGGDDDEPARLEPAAPIAQEWDENVPAPIGFNKPEPAETVDTRDEQIAYARSIFDKPEPAAQGEMPDEVDRACDLLEWSGNVNAAAALRDAWLAHSQPVAVGMTEEPEARMAMAKAGVEKSNDRYSYASHEWKMGFRVGWIDGNDYAVRQQAAQGKPKVELPKVGIPVPVDALKRACATCSLDDCMTIAGWLDAVEGRK